MLMALTGLTILFAYGAAAVLAYRGLAFLWAHRPDPITTALALVVGALTFSYLSYQLGTARILRGLGAEELERARAPEVYRLVDELADEVGIEPPRVLVARMDAPNALALGGPGGEVVLDARLFRLLSGRELRAILAHEFAHLENRDGLVQTLGYALIQTVAGLLLIALLPIVLLASGLARAMGYVRGKSFTDIQRASAVAGAAVTSLAVLLLFAFTLALRAYSRRRELAADDRAVELTGDPSALASALATIERATAPSGPLSSLYIHGDEEGTLTELLATHPPMANRVKRLRRQAHQARSGNRIAVR